MAETRFYSIAEQVARHLHGELLQGRWSGEMPGKHQLSEELGVNHKTVEAALRQLEEEGLLVARGAGRKRLIRLPKGPGVKTLRVAILISETADLKTDYLLDLRHRLVAAGHRVVVPPRSMVELAMDLKRITRMVEETEADAWLVAAGSRELLEWFAARKVPVLALFGRRRGLPIASTGPDKPPAIAAATRRLIALGHRLIVLLVRPRRRLPGPGASERAFLDELAAHGIPPGPYHLPAWEVTIDSFHGRLESLFQVTPPTALIIDEVPFFVAALQFCLNHGLKVPQDVSLVCTDSDPAFDWCRPSVSHIHWESGPVVRRILRWAEHVGHGRKDLRQTLTPAKFVPGGTIGPAKGE